MKGNRYSGPDKYESHSGEHWVTLHYTTVWWDKSRDGNHKRSNSYPCAIDKYDVDKDTAEKEAKEELISIEAKGEEEKQNPDYSMFYTIEEVNIEYRFCH